MSFKQSSLKNHKNAEAPGRIFQRQPVHPEAQSATSAWLPRDHALGMFFRIRWMSWKAPGTSRMRFLFFVFLHTAALLTLKSPCSRITFYILSVAKATKTSDGSIGHKRLGVVEWKLYWPAERWSTADVTPADRFPSSPCSRGALKMAPTWIFPFHLDLFA